MPRRPDPTTTGQRSLISATYLIDHLSIDFHSSFSFQIISIHNISKNRSFMFLSIYLFILIERLDIYEYSVDHRLHPS